MLPRASARLFQVLFACLVRVYYVISFSLCMVVMIVMHDDGDYAADYDYDANAADDDAVADGDRPSGRCIRCCWATQYSSTPSLWCAAGGRGVATCRSRAGTAGGVLGESVKEGGSEGGREKGGGGCEGEGEIGEED